MKKYIGRLWIMFLEKKRDNLAEGKQSSTQFWGYVPVSSHIAIRNHDFNAMFAAINLHFHRLNIDFPIIPHMKTSIEFF